MKKKIFLIGVLLWANSSFAAFNGLSHHSRANCVNNETVSWDFTQPWYMGVASEHFRHGERLCYLTQQYSVTRRAALVHWGEGTGDWIVKGYHWLKDGNGENHLVRITEVNDCSIYNGWWDFNP